MTKEERYELLERYLRGQLEGLDLRAFESKLASDDKLREELELHKGVHQAITDKKLDYFSELVAESEKRYFDRAQKPPVSLLRRYGRRIAAVAAILLVGVLAYFFLFPKPTNSELFASHFEVYQSPGTFRSEDLTDLDQDFILALARYDEGSYTEAAQFFTKTLEKNPDKDIAVFLRGVSYLATNDLALAEADLKAVVADTESLFQDQGKWYLSLVYLKQENQEAAIQLLQQLGDDDKAKVLLGELE